MKIILVTRSANSTLYLKSLDTTSSFPYERIREKHFKGGQEAALRYLLNLFEYDVDWVVNIDEDAFVFDPDRILKLIEYMDQFGYDFCGMPDGGVTRERKHNPIIPNAFFNIFRVSKIKINRSTILKQDFRNDLFKFLPEKLIKEGFDYTWNVKEKYYCLFFWLLRVGYKCLYLNGYDHSDGISTILQDHEGQDFLIHTWCARTYEVEVGQNQRIDEAYHYCLERKLQVISKQKV